MSSPFNASEIAHLYNSVDEIRSFVQSARTHTARLDTSIKNFVRTVEAASAYAEAVRIQIGAASVIHSEIAQRATTLNELVSRSAYSTEDSRAENSSGSVQPISWPSVEYLGPAGADLAVHVTRLMKAVQNRQRAAENHGIPPRFGERRNTPIVILDESDSSEDAADAGRPSKKVKTASGMPSLRKKRRPVPTSILAYLTRPRTQASTFSSVNEIVTGALFPSPTLPIISRSGSFEPLSVGAEPAVPTPSNSPSDELMDNEADILMIGDLEEDCAHAGDTNDNATQVEATTEDFGLDNNH